MSISVEKYALVLSGGGVRATVFHLGLLLRLAVEDRLRKVAILSTVSGGSLAVALVFSNAGLRWPSSDSFIEKVLPQARVLLTERSLQGKTLLRTIVRPWSLLGSRGKLFADALEDCWEIRGTMKDLDETPQWFINSTCYETGRNWRFSQRHIGDWKFGHNFQQTVPISIAVAASAAIPYLAGMIRLGIEPDGWYNINPATDEPVRPVKPMSTTVRLWDGGVYENLGVEPVYKPQRGFVDKNIDSLIVSDASAYLREDLGPASGVFSSQFPFLRPPRLFDIATEQSRALRTRLIMEAITSGRIRGVLVRLGRSVEYIDNQAGTTHENTNPSAFLDTENVIRVANYATNASQMEAAEFETILRHGFETADATLVGYRFPEFSHHILWGEIVGRVP